FRTRLEFSAVISRTAVSLLYCTSEPVRRAPRQRGLSSWLARRGLLITTGGTMTRVSPGRRLQAAIQGSTIQVFGAPNALAARLIERLGFHAAYLSGAAFSVGTLALPDVGLFTLTELAQHTAYITRRTQIPLIVDADTGFGEALNVERTVTELE